MELAHRWIDRNLTRAELTISLCLIALFIGFFAKYVLVILIRVERTMVDTTIVNLSTALKYNVAMEVLKGNDEYVLIIMDGNPVHHIQSLDNSYDGIENRRIDDAGLPDTKLLIVPPNYIGELRKPDPLSIEPGSWYFDLDEKMLVYRLRNYDLFLTDSNQAPIIKFGVVVDFEDRNENNRFEPYTDNFLSINIRHMAMGLD